MVWTSQRPVRNDEQAMGVVVGVHRPSVISELESISPLKEEQRRAMKAFLYPNWLLEEFDLAAGSALLLHPTVP